MTAPGRGARLALTLLVALAGALACAPSAPAAGPYVLEISEAIEGTGFGEVACQYKEEGVTEEEQPCEELEFATKKSLKLIPVPESGSEFVHFQNGVGSAAVCNGLAKACSFTLEADSYVEARFDEIRPSLAIGTSGEGAIECKVEGSLPESCEDEYEFEAQVTLVPEPEEGWEFVFFKNGTGSASACNGKTSACTLILEEDSTVEAIFVPVMRTLTISKAGTGSGTVTCNGVSCAPSYVQGSEVTLKATPASGSTFAGWSGAGCSGTVGCVVVVEEAAVAVTATFTVKSTPPPPEAEDGTVSAAARAKVGGGKARVRLTCSGGFCKGTLKLSARIGPAGRRKNVVVGKAPFALTAGESAIVPVRLSAAARRQLGQSRTLRAKAAGSGVAGGAVTLKLVSR